MLANVLTAIRLLLIVPLVALISNPADYPGMLLALLLVVAIATDYFDGIVARKMGTASAAGQLFDHGTDFLFVSAGLFSAALLGLLTLWLPILVAIAFTQYVLDSYLLFRQKQLRMSFLGRWNGVFYFAPLVVIAGGQLLGVSISALLQILAWILVFSTLASIVDRLLAPLRDAS